MQKNSRAFPVVVHVAIPFCRRAFHVRKRVENNIDRCNLENILPDGSVEVLYNLGSKSDLERLFFDRFNAPVEFFFRPNPGMNDPRDRSRSAES
ncbi:MAG: hypothetical protein ACLSHL_15885 [Alistipes communis]